MTRREPQPPWWVGLKLIALMVTSVMIVAVRSLESSIGFLLAALALAIVARVPWPGLIRTLRSIVIFAAVAAGLQWWWSGWERAVESALDLVALGVIAFVFNATTPANDLLDAITRWLEPFRRFGADPGRFALTVSLAITSIPNWVEVADQTRQAARARGLRTPRAYLTPFVIRVVAQAHETGEALQARGLGD